jgi:pyruvate/oxaloacetate carboxyltransferase
MEMARHGCDIIDFCTASLADGTSQPSLNAFVAMMEGAPNDTGLNFLKLEVCFSLLFIFFVSFYFTHFSSRSPSTPL